MNSFIHDKIKQVKLSHNTLIVTKTFDVKVNTNFGYVIINFTDRNFAPRVIDEITSDDVKTLVMFIGMKNWELICNYFNNLSKKISKFVYIKKLVK